MVQLSSFLGPVGILGAILSLIAAIRGVLAFRKKHWLDTTVDVIVVFIGVALVALNAQQRIHSQDQISYLQGEITSIPKANVARHLTDSQRATLISSSSSNHQFNVYVVMDAHDADAAEYGSEIAAALLKGGMSVNGTNLFGAMPQTPLAFSYDSETQSSGAAFIASLHDVFGNVPENVDPSVAPSQIKIWVGAQTASPPLP